jgi:hypothetical protein
MTFSLSNIPILIISIGMIISGYYIVSENNAIYQLGIMSIFGGGACIFGVIIIIIIENEEGKKSFILSHIDNSEQENIRREKALSYLTNMRDH